MPLAKDLSQYREIMLTAVSHTPFVPDLTVFTHIMEDLQCMIMEISIIQVWLIAMSAWIQHPVSSA